MSQSAHIMAARSRRGAGSSAETQKENGKGDSLNRKTIETIKDATGQHRQHQGHGSLHGSCCIINTYTFHSFVGCEPVSSLLQGAFLYAGASEEDIMVMLLECNNDINETTSRLIDSESHLLIDNGRLVVTSSVKQEIIVLGVGADPFSQVFNKKQKKKQVRVHIDPKSDGMLQFLLASLSMLVDSRGRRKERRMAPR